MGERENDGERVRQGGRDEWREGGVMNGRRGEGGMEGGRQEEWEEGEREGKIEGASERASERGREGERERERERRVGSICIFACM